MTARNAPLMMFLMLLPLVLLTRCTSDEKSGAPTANPDGGVPNVACSSAEQCELPRSTCTASRSDILYYTNARCEGGRCVWDEMTSPCPFGGCSNGGCQSPTMTASGTPASPICSGGSGGISGGCPNAGSGGSAGVGGVDDDGGSLMCDADEDGGQCVP